MKRIKRILIGGSAGCLDNLQTLFSNIKTSSLPPIIFALHHSGSMDFAAISKNLTTELNIHFVDTPLPLENMGLYLSKGRYHIILENYGTVVRLFDDDSFSFSKPSIDLMFASCAGVEAETTLAILLSGANSDGARGLKLLAEAGAMCGVFDPKDCQFDVMTLSGLKAVPNAEIICNENNLADVIEKVTIS